MKIDWGVLTFPFNDKRWQNKFVFGAGLVLISTLLWFPLFWLILPVMGYGLRIMRNTAHGQPLSMPEWDNWGELFADGLRLVVVWLGYLIPVIAAFVCVEMVWLIMPFAMPLMARGGGRSAIFPALTSILALYGLTFVVFFIMFLLLIPLVFMAIGGVSRLAATGSVGKAFEVREVWALVKRGHRNYILAALFFIGVSYGTLLVSQLPTYTIILCCLAPFMQAVASFYLQTQMGALLGMAYYHTEHQDAPAAGTAPLVAKAKDTDPTLKTDPLLAKPAGQAESAGSPETPPAELPAAETPAPRKRRAKKSTGDEGEA